MSQKISSFMIAFDHSYKKIQQKAQQALHSCLEHQHVLIQGVW